MVPVRFDTRFYVALAPAHSPPQPDGAEIIDAAWIDPARRARRAIAPASCRWSSRRSSISSRCSPTPDAEEVLDAARDRVIEPILPRVVGEGDERHVVLPGEPGY